MEQGLSTFFLVSKLRNLFPYFVPPPVLLKFNPMIFQISVLETVVGQVEIVLIAVMKCSAFS